MVVLLKLGNLQFTEARSALLSLQPYFHPKYQQLLDPKLHFKEVKAYCLHYHPPKPAKIRQTSPLTSKRCDCVYTLCYDLVIGPFVISLPLYVVVSKNNK